MRALIVGANGQVGRALRACSPAGAEVICVGREDLNVTDPAAVNAMVEGCQPDLIFNAAAYTAVDRAESEPALAEAVNAHAVGLLSRAARNARARLVHVSTDFVFDGAAGSPYRVDAPTNPLNTYGRTKRAGEVEAGSDALVVRTSWVYTAGGSNFVYTMLRLMGGSGPVRVVDDQVGTPTYAPRLATALWELALAGITGIHHFTDAGVASWYDFAVAIREEAMASGLLERPARVTPIQTADFPTPAARPPYSVLDKRTTISVLGTTPLHWRENLRTMIKEVTGNV